MKMLAVIATCLALSQLSLRQDLAIVNARIIDGAGPVVVDRRQGEISAQ